jgi:N-acetylglutamate synthase-like GNAT family acetyltransferase
MTTRELPYEEWGKLRGTNVEQMYPHLTPESARIVVVEDEDGVVVGACAVMSWVHAEGFGITESHRRKAAVARALVRGIGQVARELGVNAVVTGTNTDEMADYLTRFGAQPLALQRHFIVPLTGRWFQ